MPCQCQCGYSAVFALILAVFSNSSKSTIVQFCNNIDMGSEYINMAREFVSNVDNTIGDLASEKMCSTICPCPDDAAQEEWLDLEEAQVNTYGRTLKPFSTQSHIPFEFTGAG